MQQPDALIMEKSPLQHILLKIKANLSPEEVQMASIFFEKAIRLATGLCDAQALTSALLEWLNSTKINVLPNQNFPNVQLMSLQELKLMARNQQSALLSSSTLAGSNSRILIIGKLQGDKISFPKTEDFGHLQLRDAHAATLVEYLEPTPALLDSLLLVTDWNLIMSPTAKVESSGVEDGRATFDAHLEITSAHKLLQLDTTHRLSEQLRADEVNAIRTLQPIGVQTARARLEPRPDKQHTHTKKTKGCVCKTAVYYWFSHG